MNRKEIITELKKFFSVKELVCNHIYSKFGELSWSFIRTEQLHTILVIRRDILKVPLTCNDNSTFTQRGVRCNLCQLVKDKTNAGKIYMSSHVLGAGNDFQSPNMTSRNPISISLLRWQFGKNWGWTIFWLGCGLWVIKELYCKISKPG